MALAEAGKEWPHFIPVFPVMTGRCGMTAVLCLSLWEFSLEFGFSFSILPTHLHVPRYYKRLKVLLVGNINFVWRVMLALGWLPA